MKDFLYLLKFKGQQLCCEYHPLKPMLFRWMVVSLSILGCACISPVYAADQDISQIEQSLAFSFAIQRQILTKNKDHLGWQSASRNSRNRQVNKNRFNDYINHAAQRNSLPSALLKALIKKESNFDPKAVSSKGCIGLTQLAPATARELGVNPWDPRQNIMGGATYLRKMYNRFGSVEEALWAFNAGPSRVERQFLPRETNAYVHDVMKFWQEYAKND